MNLKKGEMMKKLHAENFYETLDDNQLQEAALMQTFVEGGSGEATDERPITEFLTNIAAKDESAADQFIKDVISGNPAFTQDLADFLDSGSVEDAPIGELAYGLGQVLFDSEDLQKECLESKKALQLWFNVDPIAARRWCLLCFEGEAHDKASAQEHLDYLHDAMNHM